jgi:type II secretory pathway component PulJ
MIKSKRKNYFTLVETMIALFLTSMVLTLIFSFFREISVIGQETEKKQQETFHQRYIDSRLNAVFQRLVQPEKSSPLKAYSHFYIDPALGSISSSPSLIFSFNNGVKLDPDYSGYVIARLYLDHDNQLCLVTWPLNKNIQPNEKMTKEILMTQVESLKFKLYSAPAIRQNTTDIAPPDTGPAIRQNTTDIAPPDTGPRNEKPLTNKWYEQEWPATFEKIPSLLKIILKMKSEKKDKKEKEQDDFVLSFVLPSNVDPIHYPPSDQ